MSTKSSSSVLHSAMEYVVQYCLLYLEQMVITVQTVLKPEKTLFYNKTEVRQLVSYLIFGLTETGWDNFYI